MSSPRELHILLFSLLAGEDGGVFLPRHLLSLFSCLYTVEGLDPESAVDRALLIFHLLGN